MIRAEFWADPNTQSGIFIRIPDPKKIGAANSYEANIYDKPPGPEYATGGIVNFAKMPVPRPRLQDSDNWHTFEITAKGEQLTVVFDGMVTGEYPERRSQAGARSRCSSATAATSPAA